MTERLRVAVAVLVLLALTVSLTSTSVDRSMESSSYLRGVEGVIANQSTAVARIVRVPDDVKWLVPEREGWLCDYEHVQNGNRSWALQIVQRGKGVGMLMVVPDRSTTPQEQWPPMYRDESFGRRFSYGNQEMLIDNQWAIVAVNHWGVGEVQFAYVAQFGDNRAITRAASSFQIGQQIEYAPREMYQSWLASRQFPGIAGANETLLAFKELRLIA